MDWFWQENLHRKLAQGVPAKKTLNQVLELTFFVGLGIIVRP